MNLSCSTAMCSLAALFLLALSPKLANSETPPVHVDEEILYAFREMQGIKPGYSLNVQSVLRDNSTAVMHPDGAVISLDDMIPRSYFSPTANCSRDDVPVPCPQPTVFTKTDENGRTIMKAMAANGEISSISVADLDTGSRVTFEAVAPGVVSHVPADAMDEEFYSQFVYGEPTRQRMGENLFQKLRGQNLTEPEEQEEEDRCLRFRVIEVAIVAESSFCEKVGGTFEDVESAVNSIIANVASAYEQNGLCYTVVMSHLETYCDPGRDPYRRGTRSGRSGCGNVPGLLGFFERFWSVRRVLVRRDMAELFTGTPLERCGPGESCSVIGCANIETSCKGRYQSYGVNHVTFTQNSIARKNLVAHEMGHTLGEYIVGQIDSMRRDVARATAASQVNHTQQTVQFLLLLPSSLTIPKTNTGAEHNDANPDFIMYPSVSGNEQYFSLREIASFKKARNSLCIRPQPQPKGDN
jgi:Reprolysin (M12B) family zinc metalloprotease